MPLDLREGVVLAGRLRLEHKIGEGGMGTVWAATHTMTLRRVAVKVLKGDGANNPAVRRRFLREGRAASAVQHPNVVEILDVVELEDGTPGMVMELLDGESLGQRLRRERVLSVPHVASILLPAISAIGTAHAHGIVHRDLKPDNIFLAKGFEEGTTLVKVLDFGIAKITALEGEPAQSEALTGTGAMLGTPYYMAPEQLFSDEVIDYRCDIWALGVILYECLSGTRPARGDNFAHIVKTIATNSIAPLDKVADVPPEIAALVTSMLSLDKEKRPQTLRQVKEVLTHYSDVIATTFGEPVLAPVRPDAASSGEHSGLRLDDVALLRSQTNGDATKTALDPHESLGRLARVRKVGLREPRTSLSDATETQHGLWITLDGARRRSRTFAVAAVGGVLATALVVSLASREHAPAAPPPSVVAVRPLPAAPLPSATHVEPSSPAAIDAPERPHVQASVVAPSAVVKPRPASASVVAARANASSSATATAAPPSDPSSAVATPATTAPGGIVEKPPF